MPSAKSGCASLTEATVTDLMHPEKAARDREFDREALPWLDDVYRFALSLTRDSVDAEDVVQDTFLRAYKSWHTYVPGSDCRRWLFTICRKVFLPSLELRSAPGDYGDRGGDALANGAPFREASHDRSVDLYARPDL